MKIVYDVLLNFVDGDRFVEFFEWEESDILEHYNRIFAIKIPSSQMDDILNYKIKVTKDFLDKIKNTSLLYNNTISSSYVVLLTDFSKIIGVEFDKNGYVVSRSDLLIDEGNDIIDECFDLDEEIIDYYVIYKYPKSDFITRREVMIKKYLIKEIDVMYKERNVDKINYIYLELFNNNRGGIKNKYLKLLDSVQMSFSNKHVELYNTLRLSYIKK